MTSTDTFACPECQAVLRRSPTLQPGETVMCPRCRSQFPCPVPEAVAGGAITHAKASSLPRPVPAAPPTAYTETPVAPRPPIEEEDAPPPRRPRELPLAFDAGEEDEDYPRPVWRGVLRIDQVDKAPVATAAWFRCAREHFSSIVGPAVGFCLVYSLISMVVVLFPCLGLALAFFVLPPLQAGISIVALAQLKGKRWTFADCFSGFHWAGAIIGVAFYTLLLALLLIPLGIALGMILDALDGHPPFGEEGFVALAASVVGASAFAALYTRLFTFALPLVLDRNYAATEALSGSWTLTRGHFWKLLGLNILLWLINIGGLLSFGVGLMLTLPFTALVWNAGYLLRAGTQPPLSRELRSRQDQERYDAF